MGSSVTSGDDPYRAGALIEFNMADHGRARWVQGSIYPAAIDINGRQLYKLSLNNGATVVNVNRECPHLRPLDDC